MTPGADPPRDRTWDDSIHAIPDDVYRSLDEQIAQAGGLWQEGPEDQDCAGRTMFDTPNSEDGTLTVLLPAAQMERLQSQSLVRIESRRDGRTYLGVVVKGPFADPDGLRADAPIVVTTSVRGGSMFLPRYHGRVQVEVMGERRDGLLVPPSRRPLPNSPVFPLGDEETAAVLRVAGNVRLGVAESHEQLEVRFPTTSKLVLPRHTGILGTTGGGKSTTVSGLIAQLQAAGVAVVLLDTEGEYTAIDQPTSDPRMLQALRRRGLAAAGVENTTIYHLIGRDTRNPRHTRRRPFSLTFANLSPYAVMEILELSDAQEERYLKSYDICCQLLRELGIFPRNDEDYQQLLELDDQESGYPSMTLTHMLDAVRAIANLLAGTPWQEPDTPEFRGKEEHFARLVKQHNLSKHAASWNALRGKLRRMQRLRVFDNPQAASIPYAALATPGSVAIVDLSDTDSPQINNLAIAELLRGMHEYQDAAARAAEQRDAPPPAVVIVIEEAHEFLSAERIARRGRKRWLGLVFVTQLPQHLPDEVLGLINNWVLHKISDASTINRLQRAIGGIDQALWGRIPSLAPGQAVVSFQGHARPLLVTIDPTPCRLLMVE